MKTFKSSDTNLIATLNFYGRYPTGYEKLSWDKVAAHFELSEEAMELVAKFEMRALRVEPQSFSELRRKVIRRVQEELNRKV